MSNVVIEISIKTTNNRHGGAKEATISLVGEDELELIVQAAQAGLIASGFSPQTAYRVQLASDAGIDDWK